MQKRSLLLILALAAVLPSSAATFTSGTWYHVITSDSAIAMRGSGGGALYADPGDPPWSFSLLSIGTLEFVDAQISGDTVEIYSGSIANAANRLGVTPQGGIFNAANCGLTPLDCLANNNFARISIALVANTAYNLQFVAIDSPLQSSSGFFRITGTIDTGTPPSGGNQVPEPATYALAGTAFAALAWLKARKR